MGINRYYPPQIDRLTNVISLEEYLDREAFGTDSPFKTEPFYTGLYRKLLKISTKCLESIIGRTILIENESRELILFNKSTRNLLHKLLSEGKLLEWNCGVNNFEYQTHYACDVYSDKVINDKDETIFSRGMSTGHGSAESLNEALVIALAENLERYAAMNWSDSYFTEYSIDHLEKSDMSFFYHSYLDYKLYDYQINKGKKTKWCVAKNLHTLEEVMLPAGMVYYTYPMHHKDEPLFLEVSSNGVAAYSDTEGALLGGLYESFERDGFLMYWLNNIAPKKIKTDTITNSDTAETISQLEKRNLDLHLLDCRTEYGIPTVVSVLMDNLSGGIYIHAASGLNVDKVIDKIIADNQRFNPNYYSTKPSIEVDEIADLYQRMMFWHGGHMSGHIEWFLKGDEISYEKYKNQFVPFNHSRTEEINFIKKKLKDLKSDAYYYEFPDPLAKDAGLKVVRAYVPDLMPVYFNEKKKHLNVPRLYKFAKVMGLRDKETTVDELNKIPHPFI